MRLRATTFLAAAILCLAPTAGRAGLSPYSQDFEGLVQTAPDALGNDGWLVFANVYGPWYYNYGPFPAPNNAGGFCGIDFGQGGPDQGAQQLVVYSDYNNGDHGNGFTIEANVFQERTIVATDVGNMWVFEFDAKRGNLEGATTAIAFIKTLDPNAGYATTNFLTVDMTTIPTSWARYSISITIDSGLPGQILQFGFANTATNWEGSGIFYDNLEFHPSAVVDVDPNVINLKNQGRWVTAFIEPVGFDPTEIDLATVLLAGSVPGETKFAVVGDHDQDELPDLMVKFNLAALKPLLTPGLNTLVVTGSLMTGGSFSGSDVITVIDPPEFMPAASVSPNPLNPMGVLTFRTSGQGTVAVRMFDINGRLVQTLLESQVLPAGAHEVPIHGRGAGGEPLASGVYYYRVETPEGVMTGRFSILK